MSSLRIKLTEIEAATVVPVVTVFGFVPPCKEGNSFLDGLRPQLEDVAKRYAGGRVVLDFLEVEYSFGDHFGSLWLLPLREQQCQVVIVAEGATAAAFQDLLGPDSVPVVNTLAQALEVPL